MLVWGKEENKLIVGQLIIQTRKYMMRQQQ